MATYATVNCTVCHNSWRVDLDQHTLVREIYRDNGPARVKIGDEYRFNCKKCGEHFIQRFAIDEPSAGAS